MRWLAMADAATGDGGSEAARGGGRWRWAAMLVGGEALGDGRRGSWRWNSAVASGSLGPGRAGSGLLRAPTKWGGAGADMARCGWSSGAVELRWRAPIGGSEVAGEMDTSSAAWTRPAARGEEKLGFHPRIDPKFRGGVLFYR